MRLILGYGSGGGGFYPYTQKPVDYQPYRPIYLYRGPPPDLGFSYGLFEDETEQKYYYADLGLDSFSPFSGKPSKLLKELDYPELERELGDFKEQLVPHVCFGCGARFVQNFSKHLKGREHYFCHRCGAQL